MSSFDKSRNSVPSSFVSSPPKTRCSNCLGAVDSLTNVPPSVDPRAVERQTRQRLCKVRAARSPPGAAELLFASFPCYASTMTTSSKPNSAAADTPAAAAHLAFHVADAHAGERLDRFLSEQARSGEIQLARNR